MVDALPDNEVYLCPLDTLWLLRAGISSAWHCAVCDWAFEDVGAKRGDGSLCNGIVKWCILLLFELWQ